ncbi:MAG: ATP-grasp domain-containing protein [Flavobacterium sp.]
MKKKLLILGGGFGQMPAILAAKKMGIETIVADMNAAAVGAPVADHFYEVNTIDKEAVLSIAKEHNVNGVMTMQSDIAVPTVGFVNDSLGLNGVSLEVANFCSNKTETRKRLDGKTTAQPAFRITTTLAEAEKAVGEIGVPCVVKAPDSSGSRGVTKIGTIDELEAAFAEAVKYSRAGTIIVEEFVDGLEFGAQTFSEGGKCVSVLLHTDTMSPPPYMIPVGHSFPFTMLSDEEQLTAIADIKAAVEALGIYEGPANVDLILDKHTNKVKVIEVGARIGATCLPELVEYHTGIDWVVATIKNCMGEKADLTPVKSQPVAAVILESPADGTYVSCDNIPSIGGDVLEFEITVNKGDKVSKLRKGTDRIGKIVTLGKDVAEAEKNAETLKQQLKFTISE